MKIAVIGGGFAGLGTIYHLLQYPQMEITLFEPAHIGAGASGLAAGLAHPYPGPDAKLVWNAEEALNELQNLIHISSATLGRFVSSYHPILRPALNSKQERSFLERVRETTGLHYLNPQEIQQIEPNCSLYPALLIPQGLHIQVQLYLEGLWKYCEQKKVKLVKQKVTSLAELGSDFDTIVAAMGSGILNCKEASHLRLSAVKGQILTLSWPHYQPLLKHSLCGPNYITIPDENRFVKIGSSYEKDFSNLQPTDQITQELIDKTTLFCPAAQSCTLVDAKVGLRLYGRHKHIPMIGPLAKDNKWWVFTGLGSKGLLHHAWLSKRLARAIAQNNPQLLPFEVLI